MTDSLAARAAQIAMRGAAEYLRRQCAGNKVNMETLVAQLKARVVDAIPGALADAKEALACGMHAVAEQTFAASMTLAGIEAAKTALLV